MVRLACSKKVRCKNLTANMPQMRIWAHLWRCTSMWTQTRISAQATVIWEIECTVNHNNIRTPLSKMNLHWLKGETWLYFDFLFVN